MSWAHAQGWSVYWRGGRGHKAVYTFMECFTCLMNIIWIYIIWSNINILISSIYIYIIIFIIINIHMWNIPWMCTLLYAPPPTSPTPICYPCQPSICVYIFFLSLVHVWEPFMGPICAHSHGHNSWQLHLRWLLVYSTLITHLLQCNT